MLGGCRCSPSPVGTIAVLVQDDHDEARTCLANVPSGELECPDLLRGHFPGPSSPDRSTLLLVSPGADGDVLHTWSPGDRELTYLAGPGSPLREPAWSTDGSHVVFRGRIAQTTGVWRVPATGGRPELLSDAILGDYEPHADAAGRVVFASSRDGHAQIYLRDADTTVTRLTNHPHDDVHPRFSPDAHHLAWLSDDAETRRVYVRTGENVAALGDASAQLAFAWAPDSSALAVVERYGSGHRLVTRAVDGALLHTFDLAADPSPPTFSPDGQTLCWTSTGGAQVTVRCGSVDGEVFPAIIAAEHGETWLPRWLGGGAQR